MTAGERRRYLAHTKKPRSYGRNTIAVSPLLKLILVEYDEIGIPFVVISGDRRDGVELFGGSSQKELYDKWRAGVPGYLPANPPGQSTHEYRNGGSTGTPAYPGRKRGAVLPPQCLGLDLSSNGEASNFCDRTRAAGLPFFQPYPTTSELHHVNAKFSIRDAFRWLERRGVIK